MPLVATCFATDVTPTTATLWGVVSAAGSSGTAAVYDWIWGTSPDDMKGDPDGTTSISPDPVVQLVSYQVSGLMAGTTYYFQVISGPPAATVTFVTPPGPPTVTPGTTTNVTSTTATLNGTVNPGGLQAHYLFGYGTDTHYQSGDSGSLSLASATGPQSVSYKVSGLTAGTTYHVELTANNSAGSVSSGDFTFTTLPTPPAATTGTPGGIGENTATFQGTVNPGGGARHLLLRVRDDHELRDQGAGARRQRWVGFNAAAGELHAPGGLGDGNHVSLPDSRHQLRWYHLR